VAFRSEAKTLLHEPGRLSENGCVKSFNDKQCDGLLGLKILYMFKEAKVIIGGVAGA